MKKTSKIITAITMLCVLLLSGCGLGPHTETDYAAAIMVEGSIYLKSASAMPAEIDESAIIGYTSSYTDSFPKKDGETNFNRELNMPYARVEGGIAVLYENEWYLCTPMEQNAVAPNKCQDEVAGNISFYEEPEREAQSFGGTVTVRLSRDLNEEQADKLKDIIDDVDEWVDDHSVDRLAYYFDGNFELSDREHSYYFTYEYNVIYYDHYYAEISAEDMQYIKDLGAECVELPDEIVQDQVSVDGDFGFAFKLVEGTFARGERICLSVVLTNQQNESYVWTGPQSHYRARVKLVNNNGTDEYTISPEPIPDTDDMGDYQVPSNEARSFEYYFCIPSDAVSGAYSLICSFDTSSQTFNDVFNLE